MPVTLDHQRYTRVGIESHLHHPFMIATTKEIQKEIGLSPLQQRLELATNRIQKLAEILGMQGIHVRECNCQLCLDMKARKN